MYPELKTLFVHRLLRARDWQDRPEFHQLCKWWRDGGRGVCALIGIGGAGKTAIADRFLRSLPQVLPETDDDPHDNTLPKPAGLFVFSFYDVPNPDTFFATLAAWIQGKLDSDDTRAPSYEQAVRLMANAGDCLLVLDGLEKVQDPGVRTGRFGQILDNRLRDFVLRVAEGYLPGLRVIITTRFRPFAPKAARSPLYWAIPIEQLDEQAAIDLLRTRGVSKGTDGRLEAIARDQGYHALSVDLIGGYIAQFCNGDPGQLRPDPKDKSTNKADASLAPRVAAIQEQERKFARLAERYHEALTKSDPAALALLQRICLFRLGVNAETLASIFTGEEKENISSKALASLDEQQLQAKLNLLAEMKLIESSEREGKGEGKAIATQASLSLTAPAEPKAPVSLRRRCPEGSHANREGGTTKQSQQFQNTSSFALRTSYFYSVHPAVRDGFLATLDEDTTKRGHDAAREGLTALLGDQPRDNPSDPATLDLLEEIVYHTLEAGHVREAWAIYIKRIGGYKNLLWRLGAYERGERICRAFAGGQPPQTAPLPEGLSENDQATFINEWALYLKHLGRLDDAARCYERAIELSMRREDWKNASIGNLNLVEALLPAGRLTQGLRAAEEAIRLADQADDAEQKQNSHAYRAHAHGLRGETDAALEDFRDALHWQHEAEGKIDRPLYSLRGIRHMLLLARLGQNEEAMRLTKANKELALEVIGTANYDNTNLLLADLARERGDLTTARDLLDQAHEWAIARDAKEPLCWSTLVRARIALSGEEPATGTDALKEARNAIEDGLRIALDCGFGIYHIDLILLRAQVALYEGNPEDAERDIHTALNQGVHPPTDSGLPTLLSATDPECGYAWGEGDARHLLAETKLLQAAQMHGREGFARASYGQLDDRGQTLIAEARAELTTCSELRTRIKDPKAERTTEVLDKLKGGVLASYPLETTQTPEVPANRQTETDETQMLNTDNFDVFLCHNGRDKPTVRQLGDELKKRGLTVWLDEWQLVPGHPWQEALGDIILTGKSAAVLVGKDGLGPWEQPEMRACIDQFVKRKSPVIPVLLPGASKQPDLPLFLQRFTWVDLREGLSPDGLDSLQWGITGVRPSVIRKPKQPPKRIFIDKSLPRKYLDSRYSALISLEFNKFDEIVEGLQRLLEPHIRPYMTEHNCSAALVRGECVELFEHIGDLPTPDKREEMGLREDYLPIVITEKPEFNVELTEWEEVSGKPDWIERDSDYFPGINVKIQTDPNEDARDIYADFDSGSQLSLISDRLVPRPSLGRDITININGKSYKGWLRPLDITLTSEVGTIATFEHEFFMISGWANTQFVKNRPNRQMLIGRDLLLNWNVAIILHGFQSPPTTGIYL